MLKELRSLRAEVRGLRAEVSGLRAQVRRERVPPARRGRKPSARVLRRVPVSKKPYRPTRKARWKPEEHPRDALGRWIRKVAAKWRITLRAASKAQRRGRSVLAEVIVLILPEDPGAMTEAELGSWLTETRQAVHDKYPHIDWLIESGSGPWYGPEEPGDWWRERVSLPRGA